MNIIIGIDTGGSYTDGVVFDYEAQRVLRKTKTPTTKENLSIGIGKCIDALQLADDENPILVCMSTTLATNAIIEGRDSAVGLITAGIPNDREFPAKIHKTVSAANDITGRIVTLLDEKEALSALKEMEGKIEALAISGYASIRNPYHEQRIKALAKDVLDVPIVCAHELTSTLGYYERTVTAVLNAKLISIIKELISDTKKVLKEKRINAQLVVMKGDGSLMTDTYSQDRPIETILSGPAASISGGIFLTGEDNAIVADMGGTTTDIANVIKGHVALEKKGAMVGKWQTRINAVDVCTFGLGGDSRLRVTCQQKFLFGPERSIPLCVAASQYPSLCEELKQMKKDKNFMLLKAQETDCYQLFKKKDLDQFELSDTNLQIISLLEDGPHSLLYLENKTGKDVDALNFETLIYHELIQRISLTPTDILHACGEYTEWSAEASQLGIAIMAERIGMTVETFIAGAKEEFIFQISKALVESAVKYDAGIEDVTAQANALYLLEKGLRTTGEDILDIQFRFKKPVIAIGAPARAWFPAIADKLNSKLIIPDDSDVANAIGAAIGGISESFEGLVRFDSCIDKYVTHTTLGREMFATKQEAKEYCRSQLKKQAENMIQKQQITHTDIEWFEEEELTPKIGNTGGKYVESKLKVTVTGKPWAFKDLK